MASPSLLPDLLIKRALWLILLLCIIRLWIMPLPSSFWVDETGTVFVVRQGAHHPSLSVAPQVPASIYFSLPRAADRLLPLLSNAQGVMEVVYRLPSIFAMALALFLIAKIASRLIHPHAGWFAVFACLSLRGFNYEAGDARPYALAILVVCCAALFLIRWLDRGAFFDAALFVCFAALIWRVHLLYWPFYIVLFVYALVRLWRYETPVTRISALAIFSLVTLSLIPVGLQALSLSRQAGAHVIAPVPTPKELLRELKFGLIFVSIALALLLRVRSGAVVEKTQSRSDSLMLMAWWLIPPAALFAFSWITGNSVFVHRYISFGLPGIALAATGAAAFFLPKDRWHWAALILGAGTLILLGAWNQAWPPHHNSDWRGAAAAINALPDISTLPVICTSPFIEAKAPAWNPQYSLPGFLYAHLATYPVHAHLVLFPYQISPAMEQWASHLELSSTFVIYGQAPGVDSLRTWYLKQPQYSNWSYRKIGNFGDVSAILLAARRLEGRSGHTRWPESGP